MTTLASQCAACKHLNRDIVNRNVCKAFPNGIPDDVLWNLRSHQESIDGDSGIVFEAVSGVLGKLLGTPTP